MGKRMAMLSVLPVAGLVLIGMVAVAPNVFGAGKAIPFLGIENGYEEWIVGGESGVWIGKEAINEALTEGTENTIDDEGSEFVHEIEWEKAGMKPISFDTAEEALEFATDEIRYKSDFENYGVMEAWANPEKTLEKGSGDCEDKAILLASLLKFHTKEYAKNDMVFVRIAPYYGGLHAQVVWKHLQGWYLLDPTSGYINRMCAPIIGAYGTLWFNDETVKGWLPGYYEPGKREFDKPEIYPKLQPFEFRHYEREFHRGKIVVIPGYSYREIPLPERTPEKTNLVYKITIRNGTVTITEKGKLITTTNLSEGEKFVYSTNDPIYLRVEVSRDEEISAVIEVQNSIYVSGK